MLLLAGY